MTPVPRPIEGPIRLMRENVTAAEAAGLPAPRFTFYSASNLDKLPAPSWLIGEAIPRNAIVGLIGPKGTFKTFLALFLAFCIAIGRPVHGRRTQRARVAYVFAEGPFGALARIEALCKLYSHLDEIEITRDMVWIDFLPSRVPLNDPRSVDVLIADINAQIEPPEIIFIDTVNANLDGDEDGRGMNGFVSGCMRLRDTFNATIAVVHHTPLSDDGRGRGHSSLDGALDARFIVNRDADRVTLECTHQRNAADGWSMAFEAFPIAGSLALKQVDLNSGELSGNRLQCLEEVHRMGHSTYSVWLKETELKDSSFKRARNWLLASGYVRKEGKSYAITDAGTLALTSIGSMKGSHA